MKVSVSLPDEDVEFLGSYAQAQGFDSPSAVVHQAVGLLRDAELGGAYAEAWTEWGGLRSRAAVGSGGPAVYRHRLAG
jgi:Arc/MetJ-type ribon-helix-helix transcriptional regulator